MLHNTMSVYLRCDVILDCARITDYMVLNQLYDDIKLDLIIHDSFVIVVISRYILLSLSFLGIF